MKSVNCRGQGGADRPREKGGQRRRGRGGGLRAGEVPPRLSLEIGGRKQVKRPARPR